jgi:small subunit ribosomal protein S4
MRDTGPKVKRSRQLGIALTPKAARIMARRPNPPGQHGPERARSARQASDYKRQLLEKQRLKAQYQIHERQMRNYFRAAATGHGNTADNLVRLLETRLDALVLHGGLAPTIYAARQLVTHGHVELNGRKVTFPAHAVRPGDTVRARAKSRDLPLVAEAVEAANPPPYLALDREARAVTLRTWPEHGQVPIICELSQVVEFYSR